MSEPTQGELFLFKVGDGPEKYAVANNMSESLLTIVEENGVHFAAVLNDADAHRFQAAPKWRAALESLRDILTDPEGNPTFPGSAGDHDIARRAFDTLGVP